MTNEKILKKAIEKVLKKGWIDNSGESEVEMIMMFYSNGLGGDSGLVPDKYFQVIFSRKFAKAFWGEKDYWKYTKCTCGGVDPHIVHDGHKLDCSKVQLETEGKRGYKLHLQLMVLEEEPIKYLEKFL